MIGLTLAVLGVSVENFGGTDPASRANWVLLWDAMGVMISFVFYFVFEAIWGKTPGKFLLDLASRRAGWMPV